MITPRPYLTLGVLAMATAATPAQEPRPGIDPTTPTTLRAARALDRSNGALRGGGADYKVHFDGGGMTFVPALGRRAARSYPMTLRLR